MAGKCWAAGMGAPERCCVTWVSIREVYSGFAFSMGMERLTMLRCSVTDLARSSESDLRFLKAQFKIRAGQNNEIQ